VTIIGEFDSSFTIAREKERRKERHEQENASNGRLRIRNGSFLVEKGGKRVLQLSSRRKSEG